MDERLLKRSVQSIEMPEDMKDRIIENCRSGEAKPLFTPKKRLVYMPMAVTACVCVLVAALAGVGIWQMKVLSEGGSPAEGSSQPPTEVIDDIDIINVIPISDEDLDTMVLAYKSGYSAPVEDIDNLVMMTEEEINEYYGIDTAYLLYDLNIKLTPIDPAEVDGITYPYVFRTDGGRGEIYYDTNAFTYGEEGEICVYISKFAVPYSIPRLWSDKEQLSTISGITAAVGMREGDGWKQYRTEFSLEQYGLYFNVWCDYDMISRIVSDIKAHCDRQFSEEEPPVLTGEPLTLEKLLEICSGDCSKLSWDDFKPYQATDIGSGLYILQYDIEGGYTLLIGGVPEDEPYYMIFSTLIGEEQGIDIREGGLGGLLEYIALHPPVAVPLTLDKLREICKGDPSKLTWSDFEQFASTDFGSGLLYLQYDIEGKYTLTIGGDPNVEPYIMELYVPGQYYAIDIREDSIDEYLSQPVPEGDVINIVPLKEDEINYFVDADFVDGEQFWLTDEQLSIYYGIDVTSFGNIPSYMTEESYTHNNGMRCIWKRDGVTGIYYDKNTFSFSNADRSAFIDISMGTLMNSSDKLWENKKMRSRIGGRTVAIGMTEEGHYAAEFLSGDSQVLFVVSACGISVEELHDVLSALVGHSQERSEDYLYPSQYIDALQMQGYGKDNYRDDPAEFIFGVQHIIQDSHTVEEMYQALAEFDTEGRIDKVLLSYNGVPVTEGDIKQGMYCKVYYDNGIGWFEFNI